MIIYINYDMGIEALPTPIITLLLLKSCINLCEESDLAHTVYNLQQDGT